MAILFGGRLNLLICGGAPLLPETQDFIRAVLNARVIQGYGLTETTSNGAAQPVHDRTSGNIGYPMQNTYIKLIDWKEGKFSLEDKPNPRGEILIGGKVVSKGYYKNEQLTKEVFTVERGIRWFHTGDIGELCPNGRLKIIDRKKDLVKLPFGEYIALGNIESILKANPLIDNVCIVADGYHNQIIALITPNKDFLIKIGQDLGKSFVNSNELCSEPDVLSKCQEIVTEFCIQKNMSKQEIPSKIKLCQEEWLPELGLVTASMKIKRNDIKLFYKKDIKEMLELISI